MALASGADQTRDSLWADFWDAVTGGTRLSRPPGGSRFVATASCKTRVSLDLPVGVVRTPLTNAWRVSFAYMDGISAAPPAPMTMPVLRDWTTYDGEDAVATSLRYFSGTATYRTTFSYFHISIIPYFHNFTIQQSHAMTDATSASLPLYTFLHDLHG